MASLSVYNPDISTLSKIGSIIVHVDEALSSKGHPLDIEDIKALINDRDVRQWLSAMDKAALLPLRRDGVRYGNGGKSDGGPNSPN